MNHDPHFASELQSAAERFNVAFSEQDIKFLQSACKDQEFTSSVNRVYPPQIPPLSPPLCPLVSIAIMTDGSDHNLERCLFALEKQTEQNFEVLIAGKKPDAKHHTLLRGIPKTYITFRSNKAAGNAHALAAEYAKGTYLLYLRPGDVPHPALCRELTALAGKMEDGLAVAAQTHEALPPSPLAAKGGTRFDPADALGNDHNVFACSNADLFGKLLDRERWLHVVRNEYPQELSPWLRFLHMAAYAQGCSGIFRSNAPLLLNTLMRTSYSQALGFAAGLKKSMPFLAERLRTFLPEPAAAHVLERLAFTSIPATLSRLLDTPFSVIRRAVIYSHIAFYLDSCRALFPERMSDLISATFAGLHFGRYMSSPRVHAVHAYFIRREGIKPNGICVYENEGLDDLKRHLLPFIKQHFDVTCITKKKFCEYNQMEHMLFAVQTYGSVLILASFWMHAYATSGRKILQLWHGNGLMKKILRPATDMFCQEYAIASSEECREEYSRIFQVPQENILVYGTIQTDMYFDADRTRQAQEAAKAEFPDLERKRVCFFAPTFRQFTNKQEPYYFCGWDYAEADMALAAAETAIVYKKHHMLKNLLHNRGVTHCDLNDSPGRHIRETNLPDIFDWICACDVFMTDYSSAMFFPLLLNKPLVFYAPDLDVFLSEGNGTLIDYKRDVPGPVVRTPSMSEILAALNEAPYYVGTEKYETFKRHHMGACDGHAKERVLAFLQQWYPEQLQRIEG